MGVEIKTQQTYLIGLMLGSVFIFTSGLFWLGNTSKASPAELPLHHHQLNLSSNLNRMPGATSNMVEEGWYKVHYVKHVLDRIYPTGANLTAIPDSIANTTPTRILTD
mgnify:CR=1 FL=1